MKLILNLLSIIIFSNISVLAQTNVTFNITDNQNKPLINAFVNVKELSLLKDNNIDGKSITINIPIGNYTFIAKAGGYNKRTLENITITTDTTINIKLDVAKEKIGETIVKGSAKKDNINTVITLQKNSNAVMDAISSEAIKQLPTRNAADAIKRVSGISIVDNKFVIVRGLSDRYNNVLMNGMAMPSTEPDKKVFSFDILPSNILENILVLKSATPEFPGEFAGGTIILNTKDAASKNEMTFATGFGINTQSTFKNFIVPNITALNAIGLTKASNYVPQDIATNLSDFNNFTKAQSIENTKLFNNNWAIDNNKNAMPNGSLLYTINRTFPLKNNRKINILGMGSYNRNFRKEITERADYETDLTYSFDYKDTIFKQSTLVGGLINFIFEIDKKNKISLKNFYNQNTDNIFTIRNGLEPSNGYFINSFSNILQNNSLLTNQLIGEHQLVNKHNIDWFIGTNNIVRNVPDQRNLVYTKSSQDLDDSIYKAKIYTIPDLKLAGKFYSKLNERLNNAKVNYSIPYKLKALGDNDQRVKVGLFLLTRNRTFEARRFGYMVDNIFASWLTKSPNEIFAESNIGSNGLRLKEITQPNDSYTANSSTNGGFIQLDNKFTNKLKATYGVRVEQFNLKLTSSDGLNIKDYTRKYTNVLPSAVITYEPNTKTNIRLSGSQTVSRPEFREIAPFAFYDFITSSVLQGFDSLQQSLITNVDLRYEYYAKKGEILSGGIFYKYFDKPIEQNFFSTGSGSPTRTFINSNYANLVGMEVEFRKNLSFIAKAKILEDMNVYGNLALINSTVKYTYNNVITTRALQGQSNYIINAGYNYKNPNTNLGFNVVYNRLGPRIVFVGDNTEPNVWEKPRNLIDLQLTKTINKKFDFNIGISDLLNTKYVLYQSAVDNSSKFTKDALIMQSSIFGSTISFNAKVTL